MESPEVLGSSPDDVIIPYAFDTIFEDRSKGEVYSLEASYTGYIESWIQEQYPKLMPYHLDVDAFCDQYFDTWPGLPLHGQKSSYVPPEVIVETYIETNPGPSSQALNIFGRRIQNARKNDGFSLEECWRVFATEARSILLSPPKGLIVDGEKLAEVLASIPDPVSLDFLPLDWLKEQLEV